MPQDFRYEPQSSNTGNGMGKLLNGGGFYCGANEERFYRIRTQN
jgi:hypothetical protein